MIEHTIDIDGYEIWYKNKMIERNDDGPSIIHPEGSENWNINGKRYRKNGPATMWTNGSESWQQNAME